LWKLPAGAIQPQPGLAAVDLFKALEAGTVRAVWIIGSNPLATMPNRERVRRALERAELVIVQDAYHSTETGHYAHILLPGALWAEAEGTMVNSSRMVTFMPRAVAPPTDARPDWQLVCEVARRLGFGAAFAYQSAAEIFAEIARSHNPRTGYDLRGMSHARLANDGALTWPLAPEPDAVETKRRYVVEDDGGGFRFPTPNGRAQFQARPFLPDAEMPDAAFPLVLTTGRLAHQWHTRTKTGKVGALNKLNPAPFLEIHPTDAAALGVATGDLVRVSSRRGDAELPARVSADIRAGCCWAPFHWAGRASINVVTSEATDPVSLQPELKFCAVRLARVATAAPAATPQLATAENL
jgi:sulfite reductase (NADPH) flavoprotein alpha-component